MKDKLSTSSSDANRLQHEIIVAKEKIEEMRKEFEEKGEKVRSKAKNLKKEKKEMEKELIALKTQSNMVEEQINSGQVYYSLHCIGNLTLF